MPSEESSWDSTVTLSIGFTSKNKIKSSGSKTYESTKTSPQRRQYPCPTSREDPCSMESKYQMSNRRMTKVVTPKRRKTHPKVLSKSRPRSEEGEKKKTTRPPKMKKRLKYRPRGQLRAELAELSSQLQRSKKAPPSTRS